jgi:hypothetical protein
MKFHLFANDLDIDNILFNSFKILDKDTVYYEIQKSF